MQMAREHGVKTVHRIGRQRTAGGIGMSNRLRIALTKGQTTGQQRGSSLSGQGLDCSPIKDPGRRLVHSIPNYPLDAVLAKAPDVITYVEHGVCDLGIVGKDTILEQGGQLL